MRGGGPFSAFPAPRPGDDGETTPEQCPCSACAARSSDETRFTARPAAFVDHDQLLILRNFSSADWDLHAVKQRDGVILAKSDIEGSEYSLLPSLVLTQKFCLIDYIFTEWHGNKYLTEYLISWRPKSKCKETEAGPRGFKNISRVRAFFNAPFYDASCKMRVLEVDDEAYVADGMPLPTTSVC